MTSENDALRTLRSQQDLVYALIGGAASAIVGAILWAMITVATGYQIGYMAIGVGLLVGFSVRFFGYGVDQIYSIIGAAFALLGCLLGNLFSQVGFIANAESMGYFDTLTRLNLDIIASLYTETFSPIDLLFYGIAAYEGFKFAIRPVTEEELKKASTETLPEQPLAKLKLPIICVMFALMMLSGFFVSRGASGPQTNYYESGAMQSRGELQGGKEHGPWEYWWENGQKLYIGYFNEGKQDSVWQYFNEDGSLYKTGSYKKGIQHGLWTEYYQDGKVASEGRYVKARQQGPWIYYYENGNVSQKGNFVLDRPDGVWEYYYQSGQLSSSGNYIEGNLIGKWVYWSENGAKLEELELTETSIVKIQNAWGSDGKQIVTNGQGIYKSTHDGKQTAETGAVKDGYREGIWKTYFASGKLEQVGEFRKGDYYLTNAWTHAGEQTVKKGNGVFKKLAEEDTTVLETGLISSGKRTGLWRYFTPDGTLISEVNYDQGYQDGSFKAYFESGALNSEGQFVKDKRNDTWKWYFETGQLESEILYVNGKKSGIQNFYDENGEIVRVETYENGKLTSAELTDK